MPAPPEIKPTRPLSRLSVVMPARDEEGCIASTIEHLDLEAPLLEPVARRFRVAGEHLHGLQGKFVEVFSITSGSGSNPWIVRPACGKSFRRSR